MIVDNGSLYTYVDISLEKNLPFPATTTIYYISNAYTAFLMSLMLF